MKPISVASALSVAYLGWRSLGWPLIHDAPLMHYIGWLVGQGATPYRDVFDMNMPGVYLLHWALVATVGSWDVVWRLLDLGWLALTCWLLAGYAAPLGGRPAAAAAGLLFALYHLAGGAWRVGQRDFILCAFLLAGAWGVARGWERRGALRPLLWSGLVLGAGMTLKPHAGLFWLGCAAAAAGAVMRAGRSPLVGAGAVLGAGLVVPAVVFGWLGWRGGLGPFLSVLTGYVLPLYGHVGRVSVWQGIGWHHHGWSILLLLGALGAASLAARVRPGLEMRQGLAAMGVAYGAAHLALQGKGWEYHQYPLMFFLCVLAAGALEPEALARWRWPSVPPALGRAIALGLFAALVVVLDAKGLDAMDAPWIGQKERRVSAVVRDLEPLLRDARAREEGGRAVTVQVMDVTGGGIHALLRLGVRQPTRFIYDFHFFHDEGDPRIQALRAEFVSGLEAGRPAAIVVFKDDWLRPGYERLADFPALGALLERTYTLAVEGDGYRIYAKRAGS
ncbi:MAG: glycosyltransferase family 39 protein [Candidatus Rokubacteria bacterium]|nr:glycosyltransferase family 39 protein [Candidatus Rokubacteria bacterium]